MTVFMHTCRLIAAFSGVGCLCYAISAASSRTCSAAIAVAPNATTLLATANMALINASTIYKTYGEYQRTRDFSKFVHDLGWGAAGLAGAVAMVATTTLCPVGGSKL